MLYHGLGKVLGNGPEAGSFLESLGFRPGRRFARLAGSLETFAGAAAILGIATRPAALAVLVTQSVAIWKFHGPKGYENTKGGME